MLKRIFIVSMLVALTGCATHQQSNQALGAVVGGVVGRHAIGGAGGTAVGAIIGSAIGGNQPTYQPAPSVIYVPSPAQVYPDYSPCSHYWNHQERQACYRGAENRARQEQTRRNNEAYCQGYGR